MKIGILTASRTDNNGTDLQALAMQKLFNRLGVDDVEIIDYVCKKIDTNRSIRINIHNLLYLPIIFYNRYAHRSFRRKYFNKSDRTYDANTLHTASYNTIVVGSDQVWNLDITGGDVSFFLPFKKFGLHKYSYAASLGVAMTEKWEAQYNIRQKLEDFEEISVREVTGVEALKAIGISGQNDLDPILMGKKEDWNRFTSPAKRKKYILLYLVGYNPMAIQYAQRVSIQKGYDIIMLNPGIKHWKGVERLFFVRVEDWLNYIANAEIIITNSYHGLSFAILFQRDFRLCLLPDTTNNNHRMVDLVTNLQLTNYILRSEKDSFAPIDWTRTEKYLCRLVQKSEQYVKSIIDNSVCQ